MTERQLPLLLTLRLLLQHRSVREAAHLLGVSAPTVSRRLTELREWIGDPLLVRVGNEMQPTPRALEIEQSLGERLNRLVELLRPTTGTQLGRAFTIACTDAHHLTLLPSALQLVQPSGLLATLRVTSPESCQPSVAAALINGDIDAYIGPELGRIEGIIRRMLIQLKFVCVARKDHPRLTGGLDLEAFCALPHVLVSSQFPPRSLVDARLEELGRARHIALTTPYFAGALHTVAATELIATLPHTLAESAASALGLAVYPLPVAITPLTIYLQWHARLDQDPAHAYLRERLFLAASALMAKLSAPPEAPH